MAQPVLGAILAGGRSLRMGEDKLLLEIDGVPSVLRVAAAALGGGSDVVVAGRAGTWFGLPGIPDLGRPTADRWPGSSPRSLPPVAGWVAVAGVDQPWLRPATLVELARLADGDRAVVPVDGWDPSGHLCLLPRFVGRSRRRVARRGTPRPGSARRPPLAGGGAAEWEGWGEDGRSWFSVDTPAALTEGLSRFGEPSPSGPTTRS